MAAATARTSAKWAKTRSAGWAMRKLCAKACVGWKSAGRAESAVSSTRSATGAAAGDYSRRGLRPHGAENRPTGAGKRRDPSLPPRRDHLCHRRDDADVARAATEVAAEADPDRLVVRDRQPQREVARADHHAGRAIAALQRMAAAERLTQLAGQFVVVEALDRRDVGACAGDGEGDAGPRRLAFQQHRARAADAVLATQMRSRQAAVFAQRIRQTQARRQRQLANSAVDGEGECRHAISRAARARIAAWICRRTGSATPAALNAAFAASGSRRGGSPAFPRRSRSCSHPAR